jgi:ketosteroid isomerase-like protein
MSQENVKIVRRIVDAINRGDINAATESISRDFAVDWSNSRGPLSGVYEGRDQTRELWRSFSEAWASLWWDLEELIELDDDRVLTVSEFRMRGHGSGAEANARGANIWAIRDGEAASVTLYQSKRDALEAVS